MDLNEFIYQHDNDPKHTSKLITKFFINKNIPVLDWPFQSPDLNLIEYIQAYMKSKIRENNLTNKQELKAKLITVWSNI